MGTAQTPASPVEKEYFSNGLLNGRRPREMQVLIIVGETPRGIEQADSWSRDPNHQKSPGPKSQVGPTWLSKNQMVGRRYSKTPKAMGRENIDLERPSGSSRAAAGQQPHPHNPRKQRKKCSVAIHWPTNEEPGGLTFTAAVDTYLVETPAAVGTKVTGKVVLSHSIAVLCRD